MIIIIIILSLILVICAAYTLLLKSDLRKLRKSLDIIKKSDTNMRLTTDTFDKDICSLCGTINDILDEQKNIILAQEKSNSEFKQAITNISHDLRTPLTSATGYVQMIRSEKTPPEKRIAYLNIIEHRLKSLSELMNGLFEYTQIMEGKTVLNIDKVNICNVLRDAVSDFYDDFINKGFEVDIDIPETPVYLMCDEALMKRAVQNLIRNVSEHGIDYFGLIVYQKNGDIIFKNRVRDSSDIDIEKMFDRFYTADFSRSGGNAGLGLAIAKELIKNMGGEINASIQGDILSICINLKCRLLS